jgi:hypothetical protein
MEVKFGRRSVDQLAGKAFGSVARPAETLGWGTRGSRRAAVSIASSARRAAT